MKIYTFPIRVAGADIYVSHMNDIQAAITYLSMELTEGIGSVSDPRKFKLAQADSGFASLNIPPMKNTPSTPSLASGDIWNDSATGQLKYYKNGAVRTFAFTEEISTGGSGTGNVVGPTNSPAVVSNEIALFSTATLLKRYSGTAGIVKLSDAGVVSIAAAGTDYAAATHNHSITNVDGLQIALDAKASISGASFTGTVNAPTLQQGGTAVALSGHKHELTDTHFNNLQISSLTTGQTLRWDGSKWVNGAALSAVTPNGFLVQTANTPTYASRSLSAGTNISITDSDGVSANPTINVVQNPTFTGSVGTSSGSYTDTSPTLWLGGTTYGLSALSNILYFHSPSGYSFKTTQGSVVAINAGGTITAAGGFWGGNNGSQFNGYTQLNGNVKLGLNSTDVTTIKGPAVAEQTLSVSGALTNTVTISADDTSTQVATTAYVIGQAANTAPAANGTADAGVSKKWSRADHIHPTDTSREPAFTTMTGKIIDVSNTITARSDRFTLQDATTSTKQLTFNLASMTTAQAVTVPDASGVLTLLGNNSVGTGSVVLSSSPTLSGTLTVPAITSSSTLGIQAGGAISIGTTTAAGVNLSQSGQMTSVLGNFDVTGSTTLDGTVTLGTTSSNLVDVKGQFRISGAAPTNRVLGVAAGTTSGSNPTSTISGSDNGGLISITTGASPPASGGLLITVNFANARSDSSYAVILFPRNANAATSIARFFSSSTLNTASAWTLSVTSSTTGLTANTAYQFHYWIISFN